MFLKKLINFLKPKKHCLKVSNYIGVVYDDNNKTIKAVINPDYDEQLDDPAWTQPTENDEKLKMIRIHRVNEEFGTCPAVMSPRDCHVAIKIAKQTLGWK